MGKRAGLKTNDFLWSVNPVKPKIHQRYYAFARSPAGYVSIKFFTPFPGTEIYKSIDKYGRFDNDYERMSAFQIVLFPMD